MKSGPASIAIVVLLVAVLALQLVMLYGLGGSEGQTDPEQLRAIAASLQKESLYEASTDYYERYLETADLPDEQAANLMYAVGRMCQENLLDYKRALAIYTRLLTLYPESSIAQKALRARVTCLQALGRDTDAQRGMSQLTAVNEPATTISDATGEILATVGDYTIRTGDLEERIQSLPEYMRAQYQDAEAKKNLLHSLVLQRLLADVARRQNKDANPQLRRQVRDFEEQLLAQSVYQSEVLANVTVGPTDLENYYQANKEKFFQPRTVQVGHILCTSEADAQAAKETVESGGEFSEHAATFSKDASVKENEGILGVVREGDDFIPRLGRQPEMVKAILALKQGEVTAPISAPDGWHIFVNLVDRPERYQSLHDVKPQVEEAVRRAREADAAQAYIQRMAQAEKLKIYEWALPVGTPMPMPGAGAGYAEHAIQLATEPENGAGSS